MGNRKLKESVRWLPGFGTLVAGLCCLMTLAGCSPKIADTHFTPPPAPSDTAKALYLNWYGVTCGTLEYDGTVLALDPFVSWNRRGRVLLGRLRPDEAARRTTAAAMPRPDAILVGHSHYDHAYDLPMLAPVAPGAPVLGNPSLAHIFASDSLPFQFVSMGPGAAGFWMMPNGAVRVWAFASEHVPHLCGTRIAHGHYEDPQDHVPNRANHWLDGGNLTFLIDFISPKTGGIAHRVFYMDGAASAPWGLPPDSLLAIHPIDVALVSAALWGNTTGYPDSLFARFQPRTLAVVHWDNFMRPRHKPLRPVPLTDVPGFIARCRALLPAGTPIFLPRPGERYGL